MFLPRKLLQIGKNVLIGLPSNQSASCLLFIAVPGSSKSNKRRHSFQSSGVSGLAKDMDRLKVSPVPEGGGGATPQRSRGVSPRGSTRRRASTIRRSSRSGKRPLPPTMMMKSVKINLRRRRRCPSSDAVYFFLLRA